MNSYLSIVLETKKKGVEEGAAEEKRPARLLVRIHELAKAQLFPVYPHSKKIETPADMQMKH